MAAPSHRGVRDLPTPALVVDVAIMERNIQRMAAFFAGGPCRLRPHVKAHKTPEIARRQLAAGSTLGLTCATVSEAEAVAAFCDDVLIANEPIGPGKCQRVAALARRTRITVAADSVAGLDTVAEAARAAGVTVGVLIEIHVGHMRCGVAPGKEAVALARRAFSTSGLALRGVMGYEGHAVAVRDRAERESKVRAAMSELVDTAVAFRSVGLPCDVVSAGGTGTYDITGRFPGVSEIQAGSYALMDSDYGALDLGFEQAFWVLGTVISRPTPTRVVADAGHKSMTKDHGLPTIRNVAGAVVVSLNDEHVTMTVPPEAMLGVGDCVFVRPSHTDPTVNLHDVFYAIEGDRVVQVWPIAARGYPEHRDVAGGSAVSAS